CQRNLMVYWCRAVARQHRVAGTTREEFDRLAPLVREDRPLEDATSPWAEAQPLRTLEQEQPRRAFVLRTDIPALRQARNDKRMIGVEHCLWEELYADQLPPLERKPNETVARNQ